MGRFIAFLYGLVAYAIFFASFVYAIGFVEGLVVPKTIDIGGAAPTTEALIVNLLLLSVFAVQHSLMARKQFKAWWTRIVPASVERSTYVLFSSLALALLCWQWRAMPTVVWQITDPRIANAVIGLSLAGFLIVLTSTFLINHFIAFWAAPTMTVGHLLFAAATTGYIIIGTLLEERDLIETFGDEYRDYRARVSMLVPWRKSA